MKRLLYVFLFCCPSLAFAACPTTSLTFKDAAGSTQTLCFGGASGSFLPQYQPVDSANAAMFPAVAALADATTNPTTALLGSLLFGFNGTTWDRLQVDGSKFLKVNISAGSVTANAGTNLNTSALALDTSVNGLLLSQGSTTSGQKGPLVQAAVTTSAPSYTTAQTSPLSLTTGGALRVDASAGGTVTVSGTVTANQGTPTNWAVNEAQINGVAPLMNNGVSGTGSQRINVASDNSAIANWGQGATGSAVPTGAVQIGGNGSGNLTAPVVCDNYTPFSFSSTTAQKIITKVSAKKVYICSINIAAPNTNVALIEGTQTTNPCDTSTAGMAGGTTAATGWNFANATAPGVGLTLGSGVGVVIKTANANFDVCLLASAANQVSGGIAWTQF